MVQIRSLEDHKLLPGVEAGDVGEKLGYATMDNGYLSFNKVRIPRTNLLSRFVDVDKEGNFSLNGDPRMVY
jgi:alkylation response protein AidB-like acyl-CoA dehydrogenase